MVKQGDKIEYTAQAYANAETVGVSQDVTLFVPQMIVGERAVVRVNYAKNNVAYADVVQLLEKSPKRAEPCCPHFGKCGGCTLMHMDYSEQLLFKQIKVANNLQKISKQNIDVLPCVPSSLTVGYRNKLSLPVRGRIGAVRIGMYCRGSHTVVDSDVCALGGEWSQKLVQIFRKFLNQNKIAPYNEKTFKGQVRHLVARFVDNQLLVTVVVNGTPNFDLTKLYKMLSQSFSRVGLFYNENTLKNNVILGKNTVHVAGVPYLEGQHLGVKFRLRPDSFFQVNNDVKDKVYQKVKQLLDLSHTEVLVDCFSGIGILTNVLANPRYQTFAIELEPSAVKDAEEMKQLNNAQTITNVCGDAATELAKLSKLHQGKVMSLVVDPPRKGLGKEFCDTVLQTEFDNIVYVSCDSATLARDLQFLSAGYVADYVQPMDMFPNTAEVETVVHLKRK